MPQMSPMTWTTLSIMMFLVMKINQLNIMPKSERIMEKQNSMLPMKKWTW